MSLAILQFIPRVIAIAIIPISLILPVTATGNAVAASPRGNVARAPDVFGSSASHRFVCSSGGESISPCTTSQTVGAGASSSVTFTITNNGIEAEFFALSCSKSGAVASCSVPGSLSVPRFQSRDFTLSYTAATSGSSGTINVTASGNKTLTASVSVTIASAVPLVTPKDSAVAVPPSSPRSQNFVVKNNGAVNGTFDLVLTCFPAETTCAGVPSSVSVSAGAQTTVSATYTSGGPSTTGKVQLRATVSGGAAKDSGWINVTSTSGGGQVAPQVGLVNADSLVEPALCLTIASGTHGAYECGDLRIVHALPATKTMNRVRAPTLYYNSQHAQPTPLVTANVTLPSGAATPDTVSASVTVNGQTWTRKWPGGSWPAGTVTRRVVVPLTAYALSPSVTTTIPSYSLTVSNCYNGNGCQAASALSGKFVVVDRSASPFGAGWWLSGIETLNTTTMVWTGGDGSVRQYLSAGTNLWRAPSVDRPDSIVRDASSGNYTRYLPHAGRVIFNSSGQHVQTINRLGQVTQLGYSGGLLQSITLPVITGTAPAYTLAFTAGSAQITSPPVSGQSRVTTLVLASGRVTSIRDPDYQAPSWPATSFAYDGTNRIIARTNKLNAVARFGFDTVTRKLAADSVQLSATPLQYAIRSFKPAEARGGAVPEPTDSVYTFVDGPRQGVNLLSVKVDRFGAPTWIKNALGNVTELFRTNTQFPALVTEKRTPNGSPSGLVSRAGYDSHGNIAADTVVSPFGGADAITQYAWDLRFDLPTSVTPAAGPATSMAYDAIGNRLWQQTGTDVNRRVTFEYNTSGGASNGLLRAVVVPKAPGAFIRDSVFYDGMGNLYKTRSPLGRWQFVVRDDIGRDTLSISPLRATDSDSAPSVTKRVRTRTEYDVMGRVRLQEAIASADTVMDTFRNQPVITVQEKSSVQTGYDFEGQVLNVERWSTPDTAGVGHLTNSYQYDLGGRKIVEVATDGFVDIHAYDAAGNEMTWTNRKNQIITMQYDALNRLSLRITPKDSSPAWTDPYVGWAYNPAVISGDSATYTYTPSGAIATANNRSAKVSRSYFPGGAIKADTQRIRSWDPNGSFELHKYVVEYAYDLAGRRTSLSIPPILIAPNHSNTVGYGYNTTTGLLNTITDVEARVFTYQHDLAGRLESLITPADLGSGTITTAYTYDDDGALAKRTQTQGGTTLHRDTLAYDGRGKVTYARTLIDSTFTAYSGLGNLIWATQRSPTGYQNWEESFIVDALGNQRRRESYGFVGLNPMNGNATYSYTSGRLSLSVNENGASSQTLYDTLGNRRMYYSQTSGKLEEARSYYSSDGKLGKVDRRICNGDCTMRRGAYEDYRYDALGRRVLVRSQRVWCTSGGDCWSHIQRTVWDGDQVLGEIRMPGFPTTGVDTLEADTLTLKPKFGPNCPPEPPPEGCNPADTLPSWAPWYGHVTYIHGSALDQPLEIIRGGHRSEGQDQIALIAHQNWRGLYDSGTFLNGGPLIKWPASSTEIQRYDLDGDDDPGNWFGSLIREGRDGGGTLYKRNRYYDAATGRFTQEDPIGLAGGLNLYGFASGDAVNYADPFGLCDDGKPCPDEVTFRKFFAKLNEAIVDVFATLLSWTKDILVNSAALAATEGGAGAAGVLIDEAKLGYMFGTATGRIHNLERAAQNARNLAGVGIREGTEGRQVLRAALEAVAGDSRSVMTSYTTEYGAFEVRESLLAGPGGFAKLQSTWAAESGGLRFISAIVKLPK